jgi:rhamnose utilization protein RhaD (predicted bifunctional aldolase and dehydrogenase)
MKPTDADYRALLTYAARIGTNPALVQGAGGNVSRKHEGVLWVKASGTWLAEAQQRDIMVPVQLDALHTALARGDDSVEQAQDFVVQAENPGGLRPSIETTMHAALSHAVVVHVHCVETIAWAARADAPAALAPLLAGLHWHFIPYIRPGAPLARAIQHHVPADAEVLVLGNHGLVVGGCDTAAAAALIGEVARRLARPVRAAPPADVERLVALAAGTPYRPATDAATHTSATDPHALALAQAGAFYPDHVIFLGAGVPVVQEATEQRAATAPLLLVPGAGALLRADASPGAIALARCLADVLARLDPSWPLVTLTAAQVSELAGWDAEVYRRALDIGQ